MSPDIVNNELIHAHRTTPSNLVAYQHNSYCAESTPPNMDYEALKEQWSEVEDRDGVRLSWNVFPSSRMVCTSPVLQALRASLLICPTGSFAPRGADRSSVHAVEGEA